MVNRGIARQVQREGRLTHGRTGGKDDKVRRLPAHSDGIQGDKARGDSAQAADSLLLLKVLYGLVYQASDILHLAPYYILDRVVDLRLGIVDKVIHIDRVVEGVVQDVVRGSDELPLDCLLLEDFDVILDVGGGTYLLGQVCEHHRPSHLFEAALQLEGIAHREYIYRSMLGNEAYHSLENHPVLGVIKARRGELLHSEVHTLPFEKHSSEHGLLNIQGLRGLVAHLHAQRLDNCPVGVLFPGFLSLRSHQPPCLYWISGFTIMRPQCSQMTSFLPEAISIRRWGIMVWKHPPQASP